MDRAGGWFADFVAVRRLRSPGFLAILVFVRCLSAGGPVRARCGSGRSGDGVRGLT